MKTVNKKKTCIVCVIASVYFLFWQALAIFDGKVNFVAIFILSILSFTFSLFALFFEVRQENEVQSEISTIRVELNELRAAMEQLQKPIDWNSHPIETEPESVTT